jgi:alpha 1,2-mannosyltransferase
MRRLKHTGASLRRAWQKAPQVCSALSCRISRLKVVACLLALSGLFLISRNRICSIENEGDIDPIDTTFPPKLVEFWTTFAGHLETARPGCGPIEVDGGMDTSLAKFEMQYLRKPRVDYIRLSEQDLEAMQASHEYMADVSRNMAKQIPYQSGARGVVTTAGGRYTSPMMVSLRMLRRVGSELPVEVFVPSWAEYDNGLCEHILPRLGATCRILSEMLSMTPALDSVSHYQYKVFAILFSSFEDVFFLDADCFPVVNPDSVMTTEPFRSLGLVTWPDMWAQTSSHFFFDIAGVATPPVDRFSTEAGQLVYSKQKHGASLLLATYYNYYGPDYYYGLQSQNAWGQGDKETFLHAALALNLTFYDVKTETWNVGRWTSNDDFRHVGMAQYHPGDEYSLTMGQRQAGHKVRPFLMHNNFPWKLDAAVILADRGPTKAPDGSYWRLWGTKEDIVDSFGYDAEKAMWEELMAWACEMDQNCDKAKEYYRAVFVEGGGLGGIE